MTRIDGVSDADLNAYVDDQLDVTRRIEIEAYLSAMPNVAARVMSDLRTRDELRLALAATPTLASLGTMEAARRLNGALMRSSWVQRLRPAVAASLLILVGWAAHAQFGLTGSAQASSNVPEYVDVAIEAHRTSVLRAAMYSQPPVRSYDRDELLSATAIAMPQLPEGWSVTDVQVFPSQFGPSIEMALQAGDLGPVSLFAARPGHFAVVSATADQIGDVATAHWQIGEVAYTLVGRTDIDALNLAAAGMAGTLY